MRSIATGARARAPVCAPNLPPHGPARAIRIDWPQNIGKLMGNHVRGSSGNARFSASMSKAPELGVSTCSEKT